MKKLSIVLTLAVLVVGGHFAGRVLRKQSDGRSDPGSTAAARKQVPPGGEVKGPEHAMVTIVEFSDFECPFCSTVQATLNRLQREFGSQLRQSFRHAPMPAHPRAALASEAALAAGAQGKFWEMHDKLFANQSALARADLDRYARQIGLDMAAFAKALDGQVHKARVAEDVALARKLGVRGLPACFVNGRLIAGAKPYEYFKEVVEEELARAGKPGSARSYARTP